MLLGSGLVGLQAAQFAAQQLTKVRDRTLLYVGVPMKKGNTEARIPAGIYVFDVNDGFAFVKRIPTFDYPAWEDPMFSDQVIGIEASPATGKLIMSTFRGVHAFDLVHEKLAWSKTYPNNVTSDQFAISPDGKTIYAPDGYANASHGDRWHVIDVETGNVITEVNTPKTNGGHNTVWAPDGSKVFMAGVLSPYISVADAKTNKVIGTVGPFGGEDYPIYGLPGQRDGGVRPFTTNGHGTLLFVNVNGLWGFEVGDVATGKIIHRVDLGPYTRQMINCEGLPNHGIAMTPDEKELWLTDDINGSLRVFDSTVMPPKQKATVLMPRHADSNFVWPCWVTIGLDGKYVYPSTGDVIDAATKKVVASLKDDAGHYVRSEKMIEVQWSDGKMVRASDRFGRGMVGVSNKNTSQQQ
jgi:DNA-binding beta-propeller fold protein YncE